MCCSQVAYTQVLYTADTEVYALIVWMCTLIRLKEIATIKIHIDILVLYVKKIIAKYIFFTNMHANKTKN